MTFSVSEKIRMLMEATKGPDDCFALRSYDPSREPPGYWRPVYTKLDEETVRQHLTGSIEIGAYALIPAGLMDFPRCWWIVADFDGKKHGTDWKADVERFLGFFMESGANILVNRSRSGKGVHVRVLFKEPVPAWMARRWMMAWLEEASIVAEIDDGIPSSFDRTIPMQDTLRLDKTDTGYRRPGNLVGSPMHGRLARSDARGTLPISTTAAAAGNFEADGRHWEHLAVALEGRSWGERELLVALADSPGGGDTTPPPMTQIFGGQRSLHVINGTRAEIELLVTRRTCAFLRYLEDGGEQSYDLWLALASQLHRFGEAGKDAFHSISAIDPRYKARDTEQKWQQTRDMMPVRCSTIATAGWRCPHLDSKRCNGAKAPAYIAEHIGYDPL